MKTLGHREIISGLGEALKYGLTYDAAFYHFICKNWHKATALDEDVIVKIVHRCVKLKAKVVEQDEFDRHGIREVLNFGHTMAHALEKATRYKTYQHGEAVLWGIRFALALSEIRGWLRPEERTRLEVFLRQIKLPSWPREIAFGKLVGYLGKDKKIRGGKLHYVLLKGLGQPVSDSNVTREDLFKAFDLLVAQGAV